MPKCRQRLALDWLTNNIDGESSGLGDDTEMVSEHVNDGEASGEGVNVEHGNEEVNDGEASGEGVNADMYDDFGEEEHDTDGNVSSGPEEIVDEEHIIEDLDVNMEGFRFRVETENERQNDPMQPRLNINDDDLQVIDYDSFEGDIDDDDIEGSRKVALRKLKKKGNSSGDGSIFNKLFVGKEFGNREEVKDTIKAHAVETRRQISIVKNDNVRVRAKCFGTIPTLSDADMGAFGMTKQKGIIINEGGKDNGINGNGKKDQGTKAASTRGVHGAVRFG